MVAQLYKHWSLHLYFKAYGHNEVKLVSEQFLVFLLTQDLSDMKNDNNKVSTIHETKYRFTDCRATRTSEKIEVGSGAMEE